MIDRDLAAVAREHFGIRATVHSLPGEIDQNARLETPDATFVLRVSPPGTDPETLEFRLEVLTALSSIPDLGVPRPVRALDGSSLVVLPDGGIAAVLTWVPGVSFASLGRPAAMAASIGRTAAAVVGALAGLEGPPSREGFVWDLSAVPDTIAAHADAIPDLRKRHIVETIGARIGGMELSALPVQVIHNDLNDENLLCADGRIAGIIDVGDAIDSWRIAEVAIAAAYAMLGQDDPATVGAEVVAAYAENAQVTAPEAEVLFDLVTARLATSVALSSHRGAANPHHTISESAAWDLLERFDAADGGRLREEFAAAAGHPAVAIPPSRDLLGARRERLGPSLSLSYDRPLTIVRGSGAYLYDDRGRCYIDAVNNVAHVGHGHPRVVAALASQPAILNTNTRYLHSEVVRYADRLASLLPDPLDVVYLVNSGSEANELAIRMARTATEARDLACLDHGYHGNTSTLIDVSPYKFDGPGGSGRPDWVAVLPAPDPYRDERFSGSGAAGNYRREADEVLDRHPGPIAGLIAEAMPGCGGQVVPAPGVVAAAYEAIRARGGLVIADEVQTGFGRVGSAFWAFEAHGVVPDIVTLGKPIGNGHPLGAVVAAREIAAAFANGMEYFNTYGGNPVSAAVGNAVLDVIEDEGLQQNALQVGERLVDGLSELMAEHEAIGDVRGSGLYIGVELVEERESKAPAPELTKHVVEAAKADGVLLSIDGPLHNVIKIKPPLAFSADDADALVAAMARGLRSWELR